MHPGTILLCTLVAVVIAGAVQIRRAMREEERQRAAEQRAVAWRRLVAEHKRNRAASEATAARLAAFRARAKASRGGNSAA